MVSAEPAVADAEPAVVSAEPAVVSAEPAVVSAELAVVSAEPGRHLPGLVPNSPSRAAGRRGPWRVVVAETSMSPTLEPGDWLLVDPTTRRWPRRGSIGLFREPGSELLVIKRVAGRPGDPIPIVPAGRAADLPTRENGTAGVRPVGPGDSGPPDLPDRTNRLGPGEAWLLGDAPGSHDSRHYGPVTVDRLVGRAWFRYGPLRRIGPLGRIRGLFGGLIGGLR